MSTAENRASRSPLRSPFAMLIIGGILLSFALGIVFFLTIARQRSGDPIPVDAAPNYYVHDAG